ncbi:DUF6276 family protein [Halobiforma nitratireducens]|uniref:Small CPxCG-related zinc finger protein n=1 Tax=Halobiforma nitratireducens JCM 10879 TaxID=1227454 RepID=M0LLA0_9EURY|nr:DUF6276 family protein [Halobiforma nitratireducens]EMA33219.1 hypothetical protein C446_14534 [Halobiforma nitratireducens JCM 10879]
MTCSACGDTTVPVSVPEEYREHAPAESARVSCCTNCLRVAPNEEAEADDGEEPDFSRISDAFPTASSRAVPLVLAMHLCSSLATNKRAIESLLREVERAGTDPLLTIDRLAADPELEPAIDLDRRRHQLEQLLY